MKRVIVYGINSMYALQGVAYTNKRKHLSFTNVIVGELDKVKALTKEDADVIVVYAQPESEEAKIAIEIQSTLTPKSIKVQLIK